MGDYWIDWATFSGSCGDHMAWRYGAYDFCAQSDCDGEKEL